MDIYIYGNIQIRIRLVIITIFGIVDWYYC